MKKHTVKRSTIVATAMMSFILTLALTVVLLSPKTSAEVSFAPTPASMTGVWHQVDGTQNEDMTATIDHGEIQIVLHLGQTSGVYWDGSFDFDQAHRNANVFDVVSETNHPDGMFTSKLPTKTFSYKDGVLSYEFKIVGTTRTIELKKEGI